jgi:galactose mutarotase-like enzyme
MTRTSGLNLQPSTDIREDKLGDFSRVTLSNGVIRVEVLPELGGKLVSLCLLDGNHEFLLRPPEREYRRAAYGAVFEDYDTSGFDECFPTVAECVYPNEPFGGMRLPDHGELWSIPWQVETSSHGLTLKASGTRMDYTFRKRLRLEGPDVVIEYELKNRSDHEFRYLWSAHPLLSVSPGAEIVLPAEVSSVQVNWSLGDRLGRLGEECAWPITQLPNGGIDELHRMKMPETGTADKLFTPPLRHGYCALYDRPRGHSIAFLFDPLKVPYVGLWLCQGGWPQSRTAKHYTAALEPCSGRPDSLAEAIAHDDCPRITAGGAAQWDLRLQLRYGPPAPTSMTEVGA